MHVSDDIFYLVTQPALFLPLFACVLCRVGGLMLTAPIYGSETIPIRLRAALALAISVAVFPVAVYKLPVGLSMSGAAAGVAGEMMIGLIMGLSLSLSFVGIQLAGMVIGQQAGLALGEVYNPVMSGNSTILGQLFFLAALTVFVTAGGHRELLRALLDTYETVPVMSFRASPEFLELLVGLLSAAFTVAMRLAAPVLLSLLMATLVMGFLSRTMPQLNILSVGFTIRSMLALGMAGLSLGAAGALMSGSFADAIERVRTAFGLG